jgi:hypothetical protein
LEKTCTSATLSTTNPTWPDPGLNTGCRRGKPATNRLSYGAALNFQLLIIQYCNNVLVQKCFFFLVCLSQGYENNKQYFNILIILALSEPKS